MSFDAATDPSTRFIASQLNSFLEGKTFREVATQTGFHPETVRRYFNADSRASADFIRQVCIEFKLDANQILTGHPCPDQTTALRYADTAQLLAELARRIVRMEDCAIGNAILTRSAQQPSEHNESHDDTGQGHRTGEIRT
ncbi:MAG: hypothetical protein R3B67_08915 [Phycisphaerales bacterium]